MTPQVGLYYQHRYGGLYIVADIAKSTIDQSKWVVYHHCYPFFYETWIRPYDEFCDGRFRVLAPGEYDTFLSKDRVAFQTEIRAAKEAAKG